MEDVRWKMDDVRRKVSETGIEGSRDRGGRARVRGEMEDVRWKMDDARGERGSVSMEFGGSGICAICVICG